MSVRGKIHECGMYVSCLLEERYNCTICMFLVCERKDTRVLYVYIVSVTGKIQEYGMYVSCLLQEIYNSTVCMYRVCESKDTRVR